jgi:hypothetical protein
MQRHLVAVVPPVATAVEEAVARKQWTRLGNRSEHSRAQSAQKLDHRCIDFRRLLLLGPVAAARQNDGLAQFQHKIAWSFQNALGQRSELSDVAI